MAENTGEVYGRYARLIEGLLPPGGPAFEPVAENECTLQVERGLALPLAVNGADPGRVASLVDRLLVDGSAAHPVVDAAGHLRPPYPGLLVYACGRARAVMSQDSAGGDVKPSADLESWRCRLRESINRTRVMFEAGALADAATADALAECAWSALASGHESNAWVFPRIAAGQLPGGALLPPSHSSNPEAFWYHELVLLHAVAAYAVRHPEYADAASRNAEYHLNETQPDHATSEPWGLLAFIRNPSGGTVADQLLHNVRVQHPAGAQGVTAILLADVLDHLRELRRAGG